MSVFIQNEVQWPDMLRMEFEIPPTPARNYDSRIVVPMHSELSRIIQLCQDLFYKLVFVTKTIIFLSFSSEKKTPLK